ncbi:MAG: alpha/beta hydrolase [Candidatus Micrarchaeota archaeon]|nr:alpha/beta hydrolase [Candidatus Micrarchaeota archaeon]
MDYEKDFEEGYTDSSLGKIYYRRHHANGKKLIFLHGIGGTTKAWARLMRFMPDTLDISLIDLLGHGKSAAPENASYTISEQVQVLLEFVSDQNNGSSCIIGHSYGGWIAAYYASYPYPALSFVLEDSAGLEEEEEALAKKDDGDHHKEKFIQTMLLYNNNEQVIRKILESSRMEELTDERLSMIRRPTLIIWGDKDDTVDPKYAGIFKEKIKNSRLEIIEGAGHDPHYTDAERFAKIILDFINQT